MRGWKCIESINGSAAPTCGLLRCGWRCRLWSQARLLATPLLEIGVEKLPVQKRQAHLRPTPHGRVRVIVINGRLGESDRRTGADLGHDLFAVNFGKLDVHNQRSTTTRAMARARM